MALALARAQLQEDMSNRLGSVRLFYFSQTRGRMHKPDSQARIRANGQTGPSGGTAAFRGWLVRRT